MSARPLLWDFAGVDGLAVARALFGGGVARLAVWQSLDTHRGAGPCAVLRLCEGNFRAALYGGDAEAFAAELTQAARGRRVWVKPSRAEALIGRDDVSALLTSVAIKPPHRLAGLPAGSAIPARLGGRAVLLWRHAVADRAVLEVQTAPGDRAAVQETLCQGGLL